MGGFFFISSFDLAAKVPHESMKNAANAIADLMSRILITQILRVTSWAFSVLVHKSKKECFAFSDNNLYELDRIQVYRFPASYSKLHKQSRLIVPELHHAWIMVR